MLAFVVLLILASFATASSVHREWRKLGVVDDSLPVRFLIGVRQNLAGVATLSAVFKQVSDPTSNMYGQYWTRDEVNDLVKPNQESVDAVISWLSSHDIASSSISFTSHSDFIVVKTVAGVARRLFSAPLHVYAHKTKKITAIKIDDFEIPSSIAPHVDLFGGFMRLSAHKSVIKSSHLSPAAVQVTPPYIRSLYNISLTFSAPAGSQATANFLSQFIDPADLTAFYKKYDPEFADNVPKVVVVGDNDESNPGVEAELDIQYITAIGGAAVSETQYRGETDTYQGQEPFLNWLVALSNDTSAPLVNSVSYGDEADSVERAYIDRVEVEFQKAGVRGLTVLVASGDSGVGCSVDGTTFRPEWPTGSPYVLSIGATQTSSTSSPESVASFSGGGFSNIAPLQDWQKDTVQKYLTDNEATLPPASYYNATGRAYPDVSALGVNFGVVVGGFGEGVSGTSASTPLFGGVLTLLNCVRLSNGKPALGFVNPLFYKIANDEKYANKAFTDVTKGSNANCGTNGFPATKGWDGSTGLGTPVVSVLANAVLDY